jgi:hypothetical protein
MLQDLMGVRHQLVRLGYSIADLNEMPYYEMQLTVILQMAENEAKSGK